MQQPAQLCSAAHLPCALLLLGSLSTPFCAEENSVFEHTKGFFSCMEVLFAFSRGGYRFISRAGESQNSAWLRPFLGLKAGCEKPAAHRLEISHCDSSVHVYLVSGQGCFHIHPHTFTSKKLTQCSSLNNE